MNYYLKHFLTCTLDKVYQALQLMNDNNVTHLPIVDGENFIGLISEEDLLQAENDNAELCLITTVFFRLIRKRR